LGSVFHQKSRRDYEKAAKEKKREKYKQLFTPGYFLVLYSGRKICSLI